jgi:hypothetical protein
MVIVNLMSLCDIEYIPDPKSQDILVEIPQDWCICTTGYSIILIFIILLCAINIVYFHQSIAIMPETDGKHVEYKCIVFLKTMTCVTWLMGFLIGMGLACILARR